MHEASFNPFPGLRPFESSETHLFFGRDGQSEELIRRLRRSRFLAIVGTSGSGKSSIVRAGLLPALQGGLMASAGSDWRITMFRPGHNPLGNLARALTSPAVFGTADPKEVAMQVALTESALRRSSLGLIDVARQAAVARGQDGQPRFKDYENLLVVVDQFEEIFRFRQLIDVDNSKEDSAAFVKLLLEAARHQAERIYVVLTMRSDFLGDCSQFQGLPEAINDGQYLIPRMTRDERREAIIGPIRVGSSQATEPLVNQLLNDVGDSPDQLPILQHALMRTWDFWTKHRRDGEPIDLEHYRAIGSMNEALSRHADEAFAELSESGQRIAEKLFRGLTEKGVDNREVRRPLELRDVCELTGVSEPEVATVIETFRRPGRSFLMPPSDVPLHMNSLLDISHESLIRNWGRLRQWVEEEAQSARIYKRLAETAMLHEAGEETLLKDPALQVALDWRDRNKPNATWAHRYHPDFETAMNYLDASVTARDVEVQERERQRRREVSYKRTKRFTVLLLLICLLAFAALTYAMEQSRETLRQKGIADAERLVAEQRSREALEQKSLAERSEQEAVRQKAIADKQSEEADSARRAALTQKQEAEKAKAEAQQQAKLARQSELRAHLSQKVAEEQSLLATKHAEDERRAKELAISAKTEIERAKKEIEDAKTAAEVKARELEDRTHDLETANRRLLDERESKQRLALAAAEKSEVGSERPKEDVVAIGVQRAELLNKANRTAEEEQRLSKLEVELALASEQFDKFLTQLNESADASEAPKLTPLRESTSLMTDLRELESGTVAVHTLLGENRYSAILTTPDTQVGVQYPIKAADLSLKIAIFREALTNPARDPRPLGRELYQILIQPLEKSLEQAHAKTLMWSLDGPLRYIPIAALYDGQHYMIERYRNVMITPASMSRLKDQPSVDWSVLGVGVSRAQGNFAALPGVREELRNIVRTADTQAGAGVLPGTILLDEQFTRQSFLAALRGRYQVVHIASNFVFKPADMANSFLLLGDGTHLPVSEMLSKSNLFGGVDLLTLSACDTASPRSGADGREVESFAVLAQRQGAKAVLASLWPVADESTRLLMEKFYRLKAESPGVTKAEALRQSQLYLLKSSRFSHPFFWSPFILIGNWK